MLRGIFAPIGIDINPNQLEDKIMSEITISIRGPFADPNHPEEGNYLRIHLPNGKFISIISNSESQSEYQLYRELIQYSDIAPS